MKIEIEDTVTSKLTSLKQKANKEVDKTIKDTTFKFYMRIVLSVVLFSGGIVAAFILVYFKLYHIFVAYLLWVGILVTFNTLTLETDFKSISELKKLKVNNYNLKIFNTIYCEEEDTFVLNNLNKSKIESIYNEYVGLYNLVSILKLLQNAKLLSISPSTKSSDRLIVVIEEDTNSKVITVVSDWIVYFYDINGKEVITRLDDEGDVTVHIPIKEEVVECRI